VQDDKWVGHVFIDAPYGATGHEISAAAPSEEITGPVMGIPTARLTAQFTAGSAPGWYVVTFKLTGGNAVQMFVYVADDVETVVQFNPDAGQLPEGVTVDKTGNVFVSLSPLGELVKVAPGSDVAEPFGSISGLQEGDIGLIGLAVDAPGNVYGGVFSVNPDANGVWKFDRQTGAAERVPGTGAISLPNSIAFDEQGNMYITDSISGAVWRVPEGGSAELWSEDPLLAGDGSIGFPFPIGANGIAVRENTVYVSMTETGLIVTVPILPDGSAGEAAVYATLEDENEDPIALDGIALDMHGNVYVAVPIANAVLRVNADESVDTLASGEADGLDGPTSVAFGTGEGDRQSIFAVNFSVALGAPLGAGPSLVKIPVGVTGLPQP
jgi:sugar lactone lactonase YvrE